MIHEEPNLNNNHMISMYYTINGFKFINLFPAIGADSVLSFIIIYYICLYTVFLFIYKVFFRGLFSYFSDIL